MSRARGRRPIAAVAVAAVPPALTRSTSQENFGVTRFDDFVASGSLSASLRRNIPFDTASDIQAATMEKAISGTDILARAKTGTGKTIAFLLPSIERLLRARSQHPKGKIAILVISPTRELASQIVTEAERLLKGTNLGVMKVIGGTNINREIAQLQAGPAILVATPGRFQDHIKTSDLRNRLSDVRTFILDEADVLLDMGFRPVMISIMQSLPDRRVKPRQTLLFSATVSPEIQKIVTLALLPDFQKISTVSETEQATHEHVPQTSLITPLRDAYPALLYTLRLCLSKGQQKLMVFSNTARGAQMMHDLFENLNPSLGIPVLEIHSRMSQTARTRATETFRKSAAVVLFSSDVTARGMDFPSVDCVIQVGLPGGSDTYIHRLGRTARAGGEGEGIIILGDFERAFLDKAEIAKLPIQPHPATATILAPATIEPLRTEISAALARINDKEKAQAYQAFLGYYNSNSKLLKRPPVGIVALANAYAASCLRYGQLPDNTSGQYDTTLLPPLLKKTVGMMSLKNVPGLNVVAALPVDESSPPQPQKRAPQAQVPSGAPAASRVRR